MKTAFFRCQVCNHAVNVSLDRGKIAEPTRCPRQACQSQNSMQIVHNRCEFADKQVIKLQETPDNVPDGQTPHSVSLCAYEELVDVCKAGDRIEVTGIFRSNPVRINPRQRTIKALFKTYIGRPAYSKSRQETTGPRRIYHRRGAFRASRWRRSRNSKDQRGRRAENQGYRCSRRCLRAIGQIIGA